MHVRHDLPNPSQNWRDYYPPTLPPPTNILPKPMDGVRIYSTKWKLAHPNLKSAEGRKAYYNSLYPGIGQMYPGGYGMSPGMGGYGMYPGMGGYGTGYGVRIA